MKKTFRLRAFKPVGRRLVKFWELELPEAWKMEGDQWFLAALKKPDEGLDDNQRFIRAEFRSTEREALKQGDLLCVGGKHCYIMSDD